MRLQDKAGFTVLEILIVLIIVSAVAAVAIPRLRGNTEKQGVRASRAAMQTFIAKARAAAIQRGCPATIRLVPPGTVWITSCRMSSTGGTLDTLGGIENLAARYTVVMSTSVDSIRFDPRGLNSTFQQATVRFTAGSITDSVKVNAVGKVVR
jgi:prepilin-type N-terminal cleavage/methylation domain-containing protein